MSTAIPRYRFTVDDYERMAEAGILDTDQRVELLDGEVVPMTPIGRMHAACVDRLTQWLVEGLSGRVIVRVQNPLRLDAHSEPEPDLSLLRPRDDFYAERPPGPDDVLLVIEVMDTTHERDREVKLPLYAKAGVPEIWLVDLQSHRVEVCREPIGNGYTSHTTYAGDDPFGPESFDDISLRAGSLFGE